jgi:DNA repair protein RadD
MGHECGFVCGDTLPFERAETLERFKAGELRYLVNVNVLTTGFDAPNIDPVWDVLFPEEQRRIAQLLVEDITVNCSRWYCK